MKSFVNCSYESFKGLDTALCFGAELKYYDLLLPSSCTPNSIGICFSKSDDRYKVSLLSSFDTTESENLAFVSLAANGEMKFKDFKSMYDFFQSLKPLFATEGEPPENVPTEE